MAHFDPLYTSASFSELSSIISSGIPISDGLYMLMSDEKDRSRRAVLQSLTEDTEQGVSLSEAMKKTKAFQPFAWESVEIGQRTGRLDTALKSLSEYYTRQEEISSGIKNAVAFPVLLLIILLLVVGVLVTQVLPVFGDVFDRLGAEMSPAAEAVMNAGKALSEGGAAVIPIAAAIIVLLIVFFVVPPVHEKASRFFSGLFGGSRLNRTIASARFANAMSMGISSGLDIDQSLEMAKRTASPAAAKKIDKCQSLMRDGTPFSKAISRSELFSSVYCRMLDVSFKTGNTDDVMADIANRCQQKADEAIDASISRVEPILVIIMSVLVGAVLLSVMLPLLTVMTSVS